MEKYLRPTPVIDCDATSIKEKAQDLAKGQEKISEKAKCLFYFVRDEIKYNPYSLPCLLEQYRASTILEKGEGYCVQKAVLLAALARATGIPTRLRFADIRNHIVPQKLAEMMRTNLFTYHGYAELYLERKWIKATPVFNLKICQKNRIMPVEFDGRNHAMFHSHNQDGKSHIEYVQDHGHYDDLPLNEILDAWDQVYGSDCVERFALSKSSSR